MEIVAAWQIEAHRLQPVAQQLVATFGHAYPTWTVREALVELTNADGLPSSIVALIDEEVVGCASLLGDDEVSGLPEITPWLGNVWVDPAHRGKGVGTALIDGVVELARTAGALELHLVTDAAADWYDAAGWRHVTVADVHGHTMQVMRRSV